MTARKIVVLGGTGHVGTQICRLAASQNWLVTSLSRSGGNVSTDKPSKSDPNTAWKSRVSWRSADIFKPSSYRQELAQANVVVHCMGLLFEGALLSRYKSLLNMSRQPSPLTNSTSAKEEYSTYQLVNYQSAITLAETYAEQLVLGRNNSTSSTVPIFVYLSAAGALPLIPSGYISSKRAVESNLPRLISEKFPSLPLNYIFLRPGYIHSAPSDSLAFLPSLPPPSSSIRSTFLDPLLRVSTSTLNTVDSLIHSILRVQPITYSLGAAATTPALSNQTVAQAILNISSEYLSSPSPTTSKSTSPSVTIMNASAIQKIATRSPH